VCDHCSPLWRPIALAGFSTCDDGPWSLTSRLWRQGSKSSPEARLCTIGRADGLLGSIDSVTQNRGDSHSLPVWSLIRGAGVAWFSEGGLDGLIGLYGLSL